ncbi:MAG: RHS repeat-associated core domain-containing protein [Candidatus Brachytrichaceae bacterium NZ_4S206]|jgi:hypothetical protein
MYSPVLARFISPDSIVPRPDDPQSFNRYAYARNSPLVRVDPSGHADCAANDQACWEQEWWWQNRWYEAHGYFWDNGGWNRRGLANFRDEGILRDTLGEAGIVFVDSLFRAWTFAEMIPIGQGVVALAHKVGGFNQLAGLLGNQTIHFVRDATAWLLNTVRGGETPAHTWPYVDHSTVTFFDAYFRMSVWLQRGSAVHELAHLIDYNSSSGYLRDQIPKGWGHWLNEYSKTDSLEYFAEALTLWVFDSPVGNPYREALGLHPLQYPDELQKFFENKLTVHP